MQSSSEQPLVGEERYVTTLITAAKETTAILVYYSLLLELKTGFCSTIGVQPVKMGVKSLSLGKDWH